VLTNFIVPLFWNQPGYSLKPAPVLSPERTHEQNLDALKRHLQRILLRYGPMVRLFNIQLKYLRLLTLLLQTLVNLAEQHGKEATVTKAYREFVQEAALKDVRSVGIACR
jgi:phosphatidylinositol 4-phosphatase